MQDRQRGRRLTAVSVIAMTLVGCVTSDTASPSVPPPHADSAGQPSPSAATLPAPSVTQVPAGLAWSSEVFPARIDALAVDRGRLVAAGRDEGGLAVWVSNGTSWQRHAVPDPAFIEDMVDDFGPQLYAGTAMGPITRLGDTLLSLGTFFGPIDYYRPVGWRSPDGSAWEFIESESGFYGYGAITDVETFRSALLVARGEGLTGPIYSLWRWTVQSSWQRTSVRSTEYLTLESLDIASMSGYAVAVGEAAASDPKVPQDEWPREPVAWRSSDAQDWVAIALPADIALACNVAPLASSGFGILGRNRGGTASVWITADGSAWTRTDLDTSAAPDSCRGYGLTRTDSWMLATIPTSGGAAVWLSESGQGWARQEMPLIHTMRAAELNGELYVLGAASPDGSFESLLIRGTPLYGIGARGVLSLSREAAIRDVPSPSG